MKIVLLPLPNDIAPFPEAEMAELVSTKSEVATLPARVTVESPWAYRAEVPFSITFPRVSLRAPVPVAGEVERVALAISIAALSGI